MSRVAYDRPLSAVGFRPYKHTTPFIAAHGLAGMGYLGDQTPAPTGVSMVYTGTWNTANFPAIRTPKNILDSVTGELAQFGLAVLGSDWSAGFLADLGAADLALPVSFQVTIQLQVSGSGFAHADDAKAIIDHLAYEQSGNMPNSTIAVTSAPTGALSQPGAPLVTPGMPPNSAPTFTSWLEQNALWILLGVGAIMVLPQVVRKL